MSLTVRRVVTGHDQNGKARVVIDEIAKNVISGRPGANAAVIWTDVGFPVNNDDNADTSGRKAGTTLDKGMVFRVVSFGPGVAPLSEWLPKGQAGPASSEAVAGVGRKP